MIIKAVLIALVDKEIKLLVLSVVTPLNSDTDFGGFTMSKLTKKDKLNIYRERTIEHKGPTYLSKKYGIRAAKY